ncbi:hypothetical protein V2J09_001227 [Rumex salicifolius]
MKAENGKDSVTLSLENRSEFSLCFDFRVLGFPFGWRWLNRSLRRLFLFRLARPGEIADLNTPLITGLDDERLGIPEVEYPAVVKMRSSTIARICSDLSQDHGLDNVVICVTKESVKFYNKERMIVEEAKKAKTSIDLSGEAVEQTFDLTCLRPFTKATPLSKMVKICMTPQLPAMLEYKINGEEMGYIRFYIPPQSALPFSSTLLGEISNMYSILDQFWMDSTFWKTQLSQKINIHFFGSTVSINLIGMTVASFAVCIGALWNSFRKKPKGCLDPKRFNEFKLIRKTQLNHNTARFRFALPTPNSILGLPVGQHVRCRGKDKEGKEIARPYTPITLDSDRGYFELVVKMYPAGRMSHHFREMRIGDYLAVKGPVGRFKYRPKQAKFLGMLAGGSGITPMFQVTRAILENPKDETKIHLIYANVTVNDILLKEELDGFAQQYPDRFKVHYVLSQPPENWNGGAGHINKAMIQKHCPQPGSDVQILKCGPPAMNKAMTNHLNELGYTPVMQFDF